MLFFFSHIRCVSSLSSILFFQLCRLLCPSTLICFCFFSFLVSGRMVKFCIKCKVLYKHFNDQLSKTFYHFFDSIIQQVPFWDFPLLLSLSQSNSSMPLGNMVIIAFFFSIYDKISSDITNFLKIQSIYSQIKYHHLIL